MKTAVQIGRVIDIPLKIHVSFLIILGLFAWVFSAESVQLFGFVIGFGDLPFSLGVKAVLGVVLAVFLFACVFVHELGHSYVLIKQGFNVKGITLFVFGGVSQMEETPRDPGTEFKVAIVGPGVSVLLGVIFFGVFWFIGLFPVSVGQEIVRIMVGSLAFYNFLLGGFNLIPAFPTDGGRVLRAVFATQMSFEKATKNAVSVGKGVAVAMVIFGILVLNLWLVVIAVFIYFGAAREQQSTQIADALKGVSVSDVMSEDFKSVHPDMKLGEFVGLLQKERRQGYPVVNNNTVLGVVRLKDIQAVNAKDVDGMVVGDVMEKEVMKFDDDAEAFDVFKQLMRKNQEYGVVTRDDKVVGMISQRDLVRAVQLRKVKQ